jgi:hypothetical protein
VVAGLPPFRLEASQDVLGWALAAVLVTHLGAHVAIAGGLAPRSWGRALLALFVPPLAPVFGWQAGMRARVIAWAVALALYALGVALT